MGIFGKLFSKEEEAKDEVPQEKAQKEEQEQEEQICFYKISATKDEIELDPDGTKAIEAAFAVQKKYIKEVGFDCPKCDGKKTDCPKYTPEDPKNHPIAGKVQAAAPKSRRTHVKPTDLGGGSMRRGTMT